MDHSPYWIRPDLKLRLRRSAVIGFTLVAGAAALGVGTMMSSERTTVVPVITPVAITPKIEVAAPEVKITPLAPEPPKPAPKPSPHAIAPHLDAGCMIPHGEVAPGAVDPCAWDDGFPAISADGALIAIKYSPDYGPRDGSDLIIRFIDTKTSNVVRDDMISGIDEKLDDPKIGAQLFRRVAPVQRLLDARHFRTLIPLGSGGETGIQADPAVQTGTKTYAEIVDGAVRIVDPATATEIWRGGFSAARPGPAPREDSDCGSWNLHSTTVWWDPRTKTVLALLHYFTGGCMCPGGNVAQVARIP